MIASVKPKREVSIRAPPCEGATPRRDFTPHGTAVSIRAPPCEGATVLATAESATFVFQSAPPRVRGRHVLIRRRA